MALTAQEEALVRQLLDEQAAILSLAGSEATILSKLGATKVTLSDLTAVSTVADADLLLMRQGTTDKSLSASLFGAYAATSVPSASQTVQGKIEIATDAEVKTGTDTVRAVTPASLSSVLVNAYQPGDIKFVTKNVAPTGWLKANGATLTRATYPALWDAVNPATGGAGGAGNGTTTFTIPDLRGEFIRGWDDSRGVDSGRVFGSFQAGEIQSHSHNINYGSASNTSSVDPSRLSNGGITTVATAAAGGAETRPRNVALLACIKF